MFYVCVYVCVCAGARVYTYVFICAYVLPFYFADVIAGTALSRAVSKSWDRSSSRRERGEFRVRFY